jgi:hypothetical protein
MVAANAGDLQKVKACIQSGADLHYRGHAGGLTALFGAVSNDRLTVAQAMVDSVEVMRAT